MDRPDAVGALGRLRTPGSMSPELARTHPRLAAGWQRLLADPYARASHLASGGRVALLSPSLYRDLVLPVDRRIAAAFPYCSFHMHGTMLWSVDDLANTPELPFSSSTTERAL
jgi:hypothetical protein